MFIFPVHPLFNLRSPSRRIHPRDMESRCRVQIPKDEWIGATLTLTRASAWHDRHDYNVRVVGHGPRPSHECHLVTYLSERRQ